MKKIYFVAVFAILASLCGCSKESDQSGAMVEVAQTELTIGLPANTSRTTIGDDGKASWVEGDTFALWAKDEEGNVKLDGVKFSMLYYLQSWNSAIFTADANPMEEGNYTYYAVAPYPESIANGKAIYTIPAQQQGDVFNGGYDIMVATPVKAGALSADEINDFAFDFQHKMHTLKVDIAENNLGAEVAKLVFTFPSEVTGSVAVNIENATAGATLSNGSKVLTIDCANGLAKGDAAWGVILPQIIYSDVKLVAYGVDGRRSKEKNISLRKKCEAGHITPLALTVPNPLTTLRFSIGTNNLGEEVENLTITDNNGQKLSLTKLSDTIYECIADSDSATVFDSYKGKSFTATFESKSAIVKSTFTMPSNLGAGVNFIPALTVPYLFEEEFSCIHTAGVKDGDDNKGSDDRNQSGESLDGYMNHKGWNAARFMLGVGTCPRINVRYQIVEIDLSLLGLGVMQFMSTHHGRLDTPQLANLKDGASVKLRVQFDAGGMEYNKKYEGPIISLGVASHTTLSNPIDGIPVGCKSFSMDPLGPVNYPTSLSDFGTTYAAITMESKYTKSSFGESFPTYTVDMENMTNGTRICFYPFTSFQMTGIDNDECIVYIDNIKVSIAK